MSPRVLVERPFETIRPLFDMWHASVYVWQSRGFLCESLSVCQWHQVELVILKTACKPYNSLINHKDIKRAVPLRRNRRLCIKYFKLTGCSCKSKQGWSKVVTIMKTDTCQISQVRTHFNSNINLSNISYNLSNNRWPLITCLWTPTTTPCWWVYWAQLHRTFRQYSNSFTIGK